jgi:hypothetical protein
METKTLFIVAGGTDGYVDFFYTFSHDAYNRFYGNQEDEDVYNEWQGNASTIQVPVDATYESLGIKTVIENHFD